MRKIKYIILIVLCLCCIGLLAGCAKKDKTSKEENTLESNFLDEDEISSNNKYSTKENWISTYDWDSCKRKNIKSIKLFGKYEFPCDVYDLLDQDFELIADVLNITDKDDNYVTITESDIKRDDLFLGNGSLTGYLDGNYININTNDKNKWNAAIGDAFSHDDWNIQFGDYATKVLDLDANYSTSTEIKLDKIMKELGRPDYMLCDTYYKSFSKNNIKSLKTEYELIWIINEDYYFSILIGEKPYEVDLSESANAGCVKYLEDGKKPEIGNEDKYKLIDFDEILEMIEEAK